MKLDEERSVFPKGWKCLIFNSSRTKCKGTNLHPSPDLIWSRHMHLNSTWWLGSRCTRTKSYNINEHASRQKAMKIGLLLKTLLSNTNNSCVLNSQINRKPLRLVPCLFHHVSCPSHESRIIR